MARSLPPLTWFRSFEAAARTLNFTAAAEEIGLTQSAVSQQVKSLELRLGVPLFVRRPRGLALTDEGRKLVPQVAAALETLSRAAGRFEGGEGANLLTVATSVSVAQWLISPRLPELRAALPDLTLRLLSAVWPDDFHASRADVEIRFGARKQAGVKAHLLQPDRLVAVTAPDRRAELADLPLIETVGTSSGWAAWGAAHGPVAQPSFYTDTYGMALQMAAHGGGAALVSDVLAQEAVARGQVAYAHPGAIESAEGYYLSWTADNPTAEAFAQWVMQRGAT